MVWWIAVVGSPPCLSSSAAAVAKLWPLVSQLVPAFLSARANGRDSSQARVLSHAQAVAEAGRILQGNHAGHASMARPFRSLKFLMPQSPINR